MHALVIFLYCAIINMRKLLISYISFPVNFFFAEKTTFPLSHNRPSAANVEKQGNEKLIENCAEYHLSKNVCKMCKSEFYLSDGECLAISEKKVPNCVVYSSATECQTCANGYRLMDKTCVMIGALPNCHFHTNVECLE